MIAIDIETVDSNLHTLGDGSIRGDGGILCVGLYDGQDAVCVEPDDPRLKDWLASDESKCFHNGVYDLSWLMLGYNFDVKGTIHDTMTRQGLIDEYSDLDLDSCCKKLNVGGKNFDDTLENWWTMNKDLYGLRGNIWTHLDVVWSTKDGRDAIQRYNIQDCKATYNLFHAQEPHLKGLEDVYKLECDIYPLLMMMKRNGIRFDTVGRDRLITIIEARRQTALEALKHEYNFTEDIIASPKKMGTAMNEIGIKSPVETAKGNQSWGADVLDLIDHPIVPMIQEVKAYNAILSKQLKGAFQTMVIGDRIHCTFYPTKRDDGGTVTARFSCKYPNLQQVTAREEKHGQKTYGSEIRSLFLADEGYILGCSDYTAIEAVCLAHYAVGPQAEWFREQIAAGIDFHKLVQEITGITSRDVIKRMNYGFIYGMGLNKLISTNMLLFKALATTEGLDITDYSQQLYKQYHARFPVIRDTMKYDQNEAKINGYVKSISGRMHHKPRPIFENGRWNDGLYKVTNFRLQGTAADIIKHAMVDAYKVGVWDVLKLHLLVHDEAVYSIPPTKVGVEAVHELEHCMCDAYKEQLTVPIRVVTETGNDWSTIGGREAWQTLQLKMV
jgi:DNA polymerase I-like protein with 3'-5' exonuclease and polymerase domains